MDCTMETTAIDELPIETFLEILKNVDGRSLTKCRQVCKKWKDSIDGYDHLWQRMCENEFKYSSKIAKTKAGNECSWYHIYKNLQTWSHVTRYDKNFREFYKFTLHDKLHALDIDYNVLPLRDSRGIVLYDTNTLKYIPVAITEKNCIKICSNDVVTVILTKKGLFVQKSASSVGSEAFYKADNFVLSTNSIYLYNNRDIFKCDLLSADLSLKLIHHCDFDIKDIQYYNKVIHIFTDCGKIVNIMQDNSVIVKPVNIPVEWIKQIKHIKAIDDKNFVCYSRNLFKIETNKYRHLYLDFPIITALFFYGDLVLIGTKAGEVLLYRLSSQKHATKPIFEHLSELPEGKFAVQLDVCERRSGPVIVVSTFFEILLLEIDFFPHEREVKSSFSPSKLAMYQRLLRLKKRLQVA